jgi:hypothetical protein
MLTQLERGLGRLRRERDDPNAEEEKHYNTRAKPIRVGGTTIQSIALVVLQRVGLYEAYPA